MFDLPAKVHRYAYEPQDYTVLNKSATKNEYFVAQAFQSLDIEFLFQVSYWGGRVLGGQVLDFLVFLPFPTPVQVYGNYWHRGQMNAKDRFSEIQIASLFGLEPIILWSDETETFEAALQAVKAKVV